MQSGKESHCCLMRTHWPLAQRNWLGRQTAARRSLAFRGATGCDAARCAACPATKTQQEGLRSKCRADKWDPFEDGVREWSQQIQSPPSPR